VDHPSVALGEEICKAEAKATRERRAKNNCMLKVESTKGMKKMNVVLSRGKKRRVGVR